MRREGNPLMKLIRSQIEQVGAFVCAADLRVAQLRQYMIISTQAEVHEMQWRSLTSRTHTAV